MSQQAMRVAVTGAAGQIGYALVFRIASGAMFGPQTKICLHLLERPEALGALAGVEMELDDCAFPLLSSVTCTADPTIAFRDADWALLVGSVPRKGGMERKDLLMINGGIFVEQGAALSAYAKPTCKVLVIGNPCNTNAYIAKSVAKNLPSENFFAMMMLDQNRASAQLAKKAGEPVSAVSHVAVWGNHSATQYPDAYHAYINGREAAAVISDDAWITGDFIRSVQQRGAAIIQARGSSSAASAAAAIVDTVRYICTPTPPGEWFSVAVCSDGSYGADEGLICGFPVRSNGTSVTIVPGLGHSAWAQEKIASSIAELREERQIVLSLLRRK